jgi:hypothetical protein
LFICLFAYLFLLLSHVVVIFWLGQFVLFHQCRDTLEAIVKESTRFQIVTLSSVPRERITVDIRDEPTGKLLAYELKKQEVGWRRHVVVWLVGCLFGCLFVCFGLVI